MIWLVFSSGAVALALIVFNMQPVWLQYLAFIISLSLFLTYLLKNTGAGNSRFANLFKKKGVFIFLFALFFIGNFLVRRYDVVYDLSQYQAYDLSEQSIHWLRQIKEPTEIQIFLQTEDKYYPYAEWLQTQINKQTNHVKVVVKNINQDVLLTKKYDVTKTGQVVLVSGEKWTRVEDFKEKTIIPGLIRLLARTDASLCFLTGHGEPDIEDNTNNGLGHLKAYLQDVGYVSKAVSLDQNTIESIEKDCNVLIITSPKGSFLPAEETRIFDLFSRLQIPLFLALDFASPDVYKKALSKEGVILTGNLVEDQANPKTGTPLTNLVLYAGAQVFPIVKKLQGKIYMPQVQDIELNQQLSQFPTMVWAPFLQTPVTETITLGKSKNKQGPFVIAAYALNEQKHPKRILLGTGKALGKGAVAFGENLNVILSSLTWLLEEDSMQWVDFRHPEEIYIDFSDQETFWIKNISLYGFPGIVFLAIFSLWFKRRVRS